MGGSADANTARDRDDADHTAIVVRLESLMIDLGAFKPTFVYTIYIASTPDKVWQALTGAEFSRQYFSGFAVELEEHVGGRFLVRTPDGSEHVTGDVIACEPPLRLVVTWDVNWPGLIDALGRTLVSYDLEQAGDAVRLTLTQSNDRPLDDDILSGGRTGWP